MLERWPALEDRPLLELVRALPGPLAPPPARADDLVARAELHGLADVVFDGWQASGVDVDARVAQAVLSRRVARELDHSAHLAMLRRIDEAFAAAGLRGVVLKGPLFAERYYARPAFRGTSDIDLLVRERDIDAATAALLPLGYRQSEEASEARFRREHHHLHFHHEHALALELHFHAYVGFGGVMRSEGLIERGVAAPMALGALRVLSREDELVYLAVHAAAHRFGRLSWLYDLKLLVSAMSTEEIDAAASRAREEGFARVVTLAARLLVDGLGVDEHRVGPLLQGGGRTRTSMAAKLAPEPSSSVLRSATRFAYGVLLCDSLAASLRYATRSSAAYMRRQLGVDS